MSGGLAVRAADIAVALGSARRSGQWWRCVCPVHRSRTGRSLSLALRDGDRGFVVHCHAGCSRVDILAELRRLRLIGDDRRSEASANDRADDRYDRERRIMAARRIWDRARDVRGSPAVRYLAGRGITIPLPPSLRWAPSLPRPDRTSGPAMVARIDGLDGELVGVHRTYLTRDDRGQWCRRDRASLGLVGGGAVRLAPAAEALMIGEGIETCLAAMQATAQPAWAALSTSGVIALQLPPSVRTVVILADNDTNGAGERAAQTATRRWIIEGRQVRLAMPPEPGTDFADVLAGRANARIVEVRDVAA
jgi:hypothetical protein